MIQKTNNNNALIHPVENEKSWKEPIYDDFCEP